MFKAGVAIAFCEMAPLLQKEFTQTRILPVLYELMKSENTDVRMNILGNAEKVVEVIGKDFFS